MNTNNTSTEIVIAASMPSGVEHDNRGVVFDNPFNRVIAASMPSGVEHQEAMLLAGEQIDGDRRFDAFGR